MSPPNPPQGGPPLTRLSHHQWKKINQVVTEIHAAESIPTLERIVADLIPKIIGAEWAVWNEHDDDIQLDKVAVTSGYGGICHPLVPVVNELIHTHPIVEGLGLIGNLGKDKNVWSFTDFKTEQELRKVPIWHEVYQHIAIHHQLLTQLHANDSRGVTLTVHSCSTFSEEQRTMIAVLRDHLEIVCRRLAVIEPMNHPELGCNILTAREQEVFMQLIAGKTNTEIGIILGISSRTVEKHVTHILSKYQAENRMSLLTMVHRKQWPANGN